MHGGCHTQTKKHTKESRQIHKVCLLVVVVVVVVVTITIIIVIAIELVIIIMAIAAWAKHSSDMPQGLECALSIADPLSFGQELLQAMPKIRGTFLRDPYNTGYNICGSILGSPILGHYHLPQLNLTSANCQARAHHELQ